MSKKYTNPVIESGKEIEDAIRKFQDGNKTLPNFIRIVEMLRHSYVWIPCNAVFSEADDERTARLISEAEQGEGLDSLVGKEIICQDKVRFVPDILQNGEDFFFPVFTTEEEMGEYGKGFSKVQVPFIEAINLARNNETQVTGIVVNAFTYPLVVVKELFEKIEDMDSKEV